MNKELSKEEILKLFKEHSNSYLIRYPFVYGKRIEEYKWGVLIDDLLKLSEKENKELKEEIEKLKAEVKRLVFPFNLIHY